jgi:glycerol-3-phosphate dehydrogenase
MKNNLKKIDSSIETYEWHKSIILEGSVDSYEKYIEAGYRAVKLGYKGVVNKIEVQDIKIPEIKRPYINDKTLQGRNVDVLIVGGGITGAFIARELSRWDISILLIDKEEDLAMHASSRNDGMIHPGIDPKPGSKKAIYNVLGNKMYESIAQALSVPFNRNGSIILLKSKFYKFIKPIFMKRARDNKVPDVEFLNKEELLKKEPYINGDINGAIFMPSAGVIPPYKMTIACMENAVENGAELSLNTVLNKIIKDKDTIIKAETNRGDIFPKVVINAAGVFSDMIAEMAGDRFFTIHPRKGEIAFLDRKKGKYVNTIVAKPDLLDRNTKTKGGGIIKTVEGNLLIGPDAYEVPFRENFETNRENIDNVLNKHLPLIKNLSKADVINYCTGIRAATFEEDFIIEKSEYVSNLIYASGIQSPGVASAPAIAEEIERLTIEVLRSVMEVKKKENFNSKRKGIPDIRNMSLEEKSKIIKENPSYGEIICRCEEISRGEIIDALKSPINVTTTDGIKRRVRAGMGRCQGGFCLPLITNIIEEETGTNMLNITKKGGKSNILMSETKVGDVNDERL